MKNVKNLFWNKILALLRSILSWLKFRPNHWAIFSRKKFTQRHKNRPNGKILPNLVTLKSSLVGGVDVSSLDKYETVLGLPIQLLMNINWKVFRDKIFKSRRYWRLNTNKNSDIVILIIFLRPITPRALWQEELMFHHWTNMRQV